jgi:hypothetical protein
MITTDVQVKKIKSYCLNFSSLFIIKHFSILGLHVEFQVDEKPPTFRKENMKYPVYTLFSLCGKFVGFPGSRS